MLSTQITGCAADIRRQLASHDYRRQTSRQTIETLEILIRHLDLVGAVLERDERVTTLQAPHAHAAEL